MQLTAIIYLDELPSGGKMFTASCPELDIASQGETKSEALANLREAVQGFFEAADNEEIGRRLRSGATVAALEVAA
jgi:predicted RNase H-like HicB family nuclease